jgi:hypothetical protein
VDVCLELEPELELELQTELQTELQLEQVVVGAVFLTMVCFACAMCYRSAMRNQAAKTIGAGSGRQQSTIVSSFLRSISSSHLAM